jgi:hypothetical protein
MSLDPDFLNMAATSITHQALSTHTLYGAPEYSTTGSTYQVGLANRIQLVTTVEGREEVSKTTVYVLSSSATIGSQDKIVMPSGDTPKILNVDTPYDEDGLHHTTLFLG